MNPFRMVEDSPHKPWLRLGLTILGVLVLAVVARRVHWHLFLQALQGLRASWLAAFVILAALAMALRAWRLTLILGPSGSFLPVFRGVALGYLGMLLLPLGGGELLKMATLRSLLKLPSAAVATGWVLDRVFEVLGVAVLVGLLAGMGVAVQFRAGPHGALGGGLTVLALAVVAGVVIRHRVLRNPRHDGSPLRRRIEQIGEVLSVLKRPAQVLGLLGVQALVSAADAAAVWMAFHAFPRTAHLSFLTAVRVEVFLMIGAALPLLPGGMGTHQVACILALQPAGVTHTEAFAFSVVTQGLSFILIGVLGVAAALWPTLKRSE
jgi:uncharacterized protein (TIRG00374 family)